MTVKDIEKLLRHSESEHAYTEFIFPLGQNARVNLPLQSARNIVDTGIKLDYGSGAKPREGFKTSDFTGTSNLDYFIVDYRVIDLEDNSCDVIHCRNVIHHIPEQDLPILFDEFNRLLKKGGKLIISEPKEEYHKQNLFLDMIWYRFLVYNKNIMLPLKYVNFRNFVKSGVFTLVSEEMDKKNEVLTYMKD